MTTFVQTLSSFIAANIPSLKALALGGPAGLFWAAACLMTAGYLKTRKAWKTGYSRKLFHFLIFGTVVVVSRVWGTSGVCLFGGVTTLVIAYALFKGEGHFMYEAMAREKNAPHRTRFIVAPYLATLVGGVLANVYFPQTVLFGYLVAGLGDAIAEPVGTRFGVHRYRVPSIGGPRSERSLEGSCTGLAVSLVSLLLCLVLSPCFMLSGHTVLIVAWIALVSTVAEAVSPHGWDNAVLQVLPAWLGALLL